MSITLSHEHFRPLRSSPCTWAKRATLKINVIGKSDGAGLSRDLLLTTDALRSAGHCVQVVEITRAQVNHRRSLLGGLRARIALVRRRRAAADADVNIMLEHVWPHHITEGRFNVVIPNPEWFDRHDLRFLSAVDHVWTKTTSARDIFAMLGREPTLIGFDSVDRHRPEIRRERTFFHLTGESPLKGTERLLRVWARHPQWPPLIVVQTRSERSLRAGNIRHVVGRLDDASQRVLQNSSMFHLCLSGTEGWSNNVGEAMSVGAVTIAADAPPMNELLSPERGLLVPSVVTGVQRLVPLYEFDEDCFEATVQATLGMSDDQCRRLGAKARNWFLENKRGFSIRLAAALSTLGVGA